MTTFVGIEEERLVLDNGTAKTATKRVSDQRCAGNDGIGVVIEPVIRSESARPVELRGRSVPFVSARLGNQVHLGA